MIRLSSLALALIFAACTAMPASTDAPTASSTTPASSARIGTVVEIGNWRYRVLQADTAAEVNAGYFDRTLKPKGLFVLVLVELTNVGKENFSINSHDFELRDDKGVHYSMDYRSDDLSRERAVTMLGEQMPPNVPTRTWMLFDVTPGTTGMMLYLSQAKVAIRLE